MIGWVFLAALVTALATGLGAVPLAFARGARRSWIGIGDGVAAGMMTAATVALVYEGCTTSAWRTVAGAAAGTIFMALVWKLFSKHDHPRMGTLRGVDALRALTIVAVMTLHSFTEGVGVGVSFGDGKTLGLLIAVAIAVHNVPEGLAVSLVLVPRGTLLPAGLGFAGGAMLWIVLTQLVPDALEVSSRRTVGLAAGLAAAATLALQALLLGV
jgi:ZIP family zinc transporter